MSDLINDFVDQRDLVYTLTSNDGGANGSKWYLEETKFCIHNSWFELLISFWTISPYASPNYSNYTFIIGSRGELTPSFVLNSDYVNLALYRKSSVLVTGGDGSESNPYILG